MKKQYHVPTLTVHGSVESITQMFGNSSRKDFLFFSGGSVSIGTTGSEDGFPVPCSTNPSQCP